MADESGEKTEEPTPKKLEDARRKGQVWKSRDLTGALVFFAGFFTMMLTFEVSLQKYSDIFHDAFRKLGQPVITNEDIHVTVFGGLTAVLLLTLPVVLAAAAVGALSDFLQVGPLLAGDPVTPKLEKLNPIEGLKNLVSKKQLVELLKSTFKLLLAGYLTYLVVKGELGLITQTARGTPQQIMAAAGHVIYLLATRVGFLFILFAIFDVWWQRKVFMKDQMMTKEEVKKEYKESEGDPHHKAKRKEMHQEILEHAQMEDVATADVVVTNPTHYAVALKYDRERDGAPRVIAKGLDARAAQIREIAGKHDVPMMRNVPLAHALYRVDVGEEIPEALYDAVAEVLNFVYAEQRRRENVFEG
ncbi:MAG: type III secretion system export apparatus subunit SctU [Myxococcales bacterium]